jgi:hypothetical protein
MSTGPFQGQQISRDVPILFGNHPPRVRSAWLSEAPPDHWTGFASWLGPRSAAERKHIGRRDFSGGEEPVAEAGLVCIVQDPECDILVAGQPLPDRLLTGAGQQWREALA